MSRALGYLSLMDQQFDYVIVGLIALNFVLLAVAAAADIFSVDAVFGLMLLQLAATAALLSNGKT
ncbi:MAG TPA: hypothetical protein VKD91_19700 [Pyrinomonadaceae bacterium]|jgi:hypothetical protein|nr:hypothetical protein [Pyrinomonadaceae bacterium]